MPLVLKTEAAGSYGNPPYGGNIERASHHTVGVWWARHDGSKAGVGGIVSCLGNMSRSCLRCKGIQVGGPHSSPDHIRQDVDGKSPHLPMEDGRRQGDIWHELLLVTLLCGDASALLTGFLLLRLAPIAKEGPKTEVVGFL